ESWRTTWTSCPSSVIRRSSKASLYQAIPPVTPNTIRMRSPVLQLIRRLILQWYLLATQTGRHHWPAARRLGNLHQVPRQLLPGLLPPASFPADRRQLRASQSTVAFHSARYPPAV